MMQECMAVEIVNLMKLSMDKEKQITVLYRVLKKLLLIIYFLKRGEGYPISLHLRWILQYRGEGIFILTTITWVYHLLF